MTKRHCFFPPHDGIALGELVAKIGAELLHSSDAGRIIRAIAPIGRAGPGEICHIRSHKKCGELETCHAEAIICSEALRPRIPGRIPAAVARFPETAFAIAGGLLHEKALRPSRQFLEGSAISAQAYVDPSARLEDGVIIEPMATVGAGAAIGAGTLIGAGAAIGAGVKIGRNCAIAAGATLQCALVGNDVILHNGARIGQDGFGYALGAGGILKLVQIGRVIIQDHVEIGANTTIDRGAMDDTVIGEGTKIDNLVQIGHNVQVGRHCVIVSHAAIAGSTRIGDGVLIGGASSINGHVTIGDGAQIAGRTLVMSDLPPGARCAGMPAQPVNDFLREVAGAGRRLRSANRKAHKNA